MTFELHIQRKARAFVTALAATERAQFDRCVEHLCLDPYIDNVTKFYAPYPPIVFCLYQDGPFRILYRLIDNHVVDVLTVSYAPEVPPISEW